ncbi:LLM class flavin-dependent oxidoreductase [Mycobacterium spongiae]|uniref:LLM class flavin-dependent oxidoreductase n=1 Tax=Mycobacterium spongiae TaxID=886343 RepID=A0A975K097_9MYCO|nr:LLM class flavin-dependent oxidoreductase [Mycobacterium spongiae]QUR67823.1 LLM class flavin-dependent oxidoreductase [Mycobacterium spongiae]
MRFSVWPGAGQPWCAMLDLARQADAGFWHCVYVADHFMANSDRPDGETGMLEATGAIAALAGATTRVRLAPLVLSMTYRHPAVLANWAATVDHASNGRLTLGIGTGWQVNEHDHYGLELGTPRELVDRFAEGLDVITGLLTTSRTTLTGRYYRLEDAPCDPKPVQSPLPLLIGGTGPRMLRLTARHAAEWNHWSSPGSFRATAERLDAACERVGRDPATILRSTQALTIVTSCPDDEARAAARAARDRLPVLYGSPARIAEEVAVWRDEGVDEVIFPDRAMATDRRRDAFDALAEALAPLA